MKVSARCRAVGGPGGARKGRAVVQASGAAAPHSGAVLTGRLAYRLGSLVAALVLAVACGGAGTDGSRSAPPSTRFRVEHRPVGPFPVLAGSTAGQGAQLFGGLTVARGSLLLGASFPGAAVEDGELALLLVTGDPVAVYNTYVDQAGGLGMVARGGGCKGSARSLGCTARLLDPDDGESLAVALERRPAGAGMVSHASLWYRPPGSTDPRPAGQPATAPHRPSAPRPPPGPPPRPSRWRAERVGGPLRSSRRPAGRQCPGGATGPVRLCRPMVGGAAGDRRRRRRAGGVRPPVGRRLAYHRPPPGSWAHRARVARLGRVPAGTAELRAVTGADGVTWLLLAVVRRR